jgi:hypothetical protein
MLTITDLSVSHTLEAAAMSEVRGGMFVPAAPFFGILSAPVIDAGVHNLSQGQSVLVDQSGGLGGFNAVASHQTQNGISGQVAI